MFRFLLLLSFTAFLTPSLSGQQQVYLDKDYKVVSKKNSKYTGEITPWENGIYMKVFIDGRLYSDGYYSKGKTPATENRVGVLAYYHPNGKVYSIGEVKGKDQVGPWIWYFSNGNERTLCHYNSSGQLHGRYRSHFPDNTPYREYAYSNDSLEGEMLGYFPNGKLSLRYHYHRGKMQDTQITYHLNGTTSSVVVYQGGKMNGSARYYHSNGQLAADEWYEDNNLVRFHFYSESGEDMTSKVDTAHLNDFPEVDPDCFNAFKENLVYPREAVEKNKAGRVLVTFYIDENNELIFHQVFLSNELGYGLEEAALRAVKDHICMTGPHLLHNRKTIIQYTQPVKFDLK